MVTNKKYKYALEKYHRLREQLAAVTAERDRYFDLLPDVSCECSDGKQYAYEAAAMLKIMIIERAKV